MAQFDLPDSNDNVLEEGQAYQIGTGNEARQRIN